MNNMAGIRIGLIGTGLCAQELHIPALQALKDCFTVTAVCGRNTERTGRLAAQLDACAYEDYRELIADKHVDAVIASYPFEMNRDIVAQALEAHKHVLVEKPISPSLNQAKEMAEWEKTAKVVTMVGENYRYRNAVLKAREYIQKGLIGEPGFMKYCFMDYFTDDSKWIRQSTWRLNSIGGIIMDRDIHFGAVMRFLMGDVHQAEGCASSIRNSIGPVDCASLQILFESGAIGQLTDCASAMGYTEHSAAIIGQRGAIFLDESFTRVRIENQDNFQECFSFPDDKADSFVNEFRDFHRAITQGVQPVSTLAEGCADLALALVPYQRQK